MTKPKLCKWTRKTPDGTPALRGPLEELRKGIVQTQEAGGIVTWFVGTPLPAYGKWVAYVIVDPATAAGGSWLPKNWRVDHHLKTDDGAANMRPPRRLLVVEGVESA